MKFTYNQYQIPTPKPKGDWKRYKKIGTLNVPYKNNRHCKNRIPNFITKFNKCLMNIQCDHQSSHQLYHSIMYNSLHVAHVINVLPPGSMS